MVFCLLNCPLNLHMRILYILNHVQYFVHYHRFAFFIVCHDSYISAIVRLIVTLCAIIYSLIKIIIRKRIVTHRPWADPSCVLVKHTWQNWLSKAACRFQISPAMQYCEANVKVWDVWVDRGLSHCFLDTVSSAVLSSWLLLFGVIELVQYARHGTPVDARLKPKSCLYR